MTANHNFLFNGIITVALAIPSVGAQLFDSQMVRERAVANAHRLSLPEKLNDGWNRVPDSSDKSQSSVFVRTYANAAGEQLIVMVRQTPRFEEVHDFNYCLIANGLKPKLLGVVSVATSRGNMSAVRSPPRIRSKIIYLCSGLKTMRVVRRIDGIGECLCLVAVPGECRYAENTECSRKTITRRMILARLNLSLPGFSNSLCKAWVADVLLLSYSLKCAKSLSLNWFH